jgi:hypothetical protein
LKKYNLAFAVLAFATLAVVAAIGIGCEKQGGVGKTASLPASLDGHYPPAAPGPIYLASMLELAAPLSGVAADLFEGDLANAQANFESFRAQYLKVSKMVPEWESYYPMAPVDQLAAAMKSEDPGQVMGAIDNLGKTCNVCHYRYMVPVQHKYHWGDFSMLTVTDPLSKADHPFVVFKHMMETDMTAVGIDLAQGQRENAMDRLNGFEQRFQAMKEVCSACHDAEPKYYVDESVTGMIDGIRSKLNEETVDPGAVGELLQGIGQESCFKCHLVHTPAVYSKYQASR